MSVWFLLFIALQFADAITTNYVLSSGKGYEVNPFMRHAMERFGVVPAMAVLKAAMIVAIWVYIERVDMSWVLVLLDVLYAVVVSRNVLVAVR